MAGELDATLTEIVADRAPEAAVELAREVHWVNARRLCEALKRVGPAKFILDLLQHGMEPWQRRARYMEASAPGELGEQGGYHIGDGYCGENVRECKLPVQFKSQTVRWTAATDVEGAESSKRIDVRVGRGGRVHMK